MIKVKLLKDTESPWKKGKILPRGKKVHLTDKEIAKKWIEGKNAKPMVDKNELKEIRKKK